MVQRLTVALVTDVNGDCTAYSDTILPAGGFVEQLRYVKNNFDNGAGFTVTVEDTGETVWAQANVNASATVCPRQPTHSTAGVAKVYASGGEAVGDKIAVGKTRIKVVVASGGNAKTGSLHILIS